MEGNTYWSVSYAANVVAPKKALEFDSLTFRLKKKEKMYTYIVDIQTLAEILRSKYPGRNFIACTVDKETKTILFYRGNGQEIVVDFDEFKPSGTGIEPDFNQVSIIDYGHTVKLGEYEAASMAILYG